MIRVMLFEGTQAEGETTDINQIVNQSSHRTPSDHSTSTHNAHAKSHQQATALTDDYPWCDCHTRLLLLRLCDEECELVA